MCDAMTALRRAYLAHIHACKDTGKPYMKPSEFYYQFCTKTIATQAMNTPARAIFNY
jgi:hypothetical protein